jgi:dTDP-glucose 4,6-dehydratase
METLIVTGGAGFIGANLVRLILAERRERVVVVDALTYAGSRDSLAGIEEGARFRFVRADIADRTAMSALLAEERPAAVLNLAAETHVDRSIDDPGAFVHTNVLGTFELLEAARGYWQARPAVERERFRFLHVSTDEVFGSLGASGLFTESTPYAPSSPYAASKAGADHLVRAWHATFGLPALVTNCSNNFGPYQFPEKLIPLMILSALDGRDLPVYGDGLQVRDWIYVEDHCLGVLAVLERGRPGESYNVGAGNERPNVEVVDRICAVLERERPAARNPALVARGLRAYAELKRFVDDRPGHDRRYGIDASKCRDQLGWAPRHSFEEALAETVRWYLDNEAWCAAASESYRGERLGLGA